MRKRETQKATLGDSARGNSQDMTTEPRSAGWEGARGFWGKGTPSTRVLRQERAWHVQGWEKSHRSVCTKVSLFLSSENVALETDYQVGRNLLDHLEVCPSVWGEETSPGQFCWLNSARADNGEPEGPCLSHLHRPARPVASELMYVNHILPWHCKTGHKGIISANLSLWNENGSEF